MCPIIANMAQFRAKSDIPAVKMYKNHDLILEGVSTFVFCFLLIVYTEYYRFDFLKNYIVLLKKYRKTQYFFSKTNKLYKSAIRHDINKENQLFRMHHPNFFSTKYQM